MNEYFWKYYIDISKEDFVDQVRASLHTHGIATFDGICSLERFVEFSKLFGDVYYHRKSDNDGVIKIDTSTQSQNKWFADYSSKDLALHTDQSVEMPPSLLSFYCQQEAEEGGESIFADAKQIFNFLEKENPAMLRELCRSKSVVFGEDMVVSSIYDTLPNKDIYIKFSKNENYFNFPLMAIMNDFLDVIKNYTISFPLKNNQGYICKNGQWLHGRTGSKGHRIAYRMLLNSIGEKFDWVSLGFKHNDLRLN